MPANSFTVSRTDLRKTRLIDDGARTAPLEAASVRLQIGPFALTSNNVTYGLLGDALNYFAFYPPADPAEGRIPVWGFADVVESKLDGVEVGERFFGYYPPSSHVVLQPEKISRASFFDGAQRRKALMPIYNQYTRCSADPSYRPDQEAQIALFRPLFGTAVLLDDFLAEDDFRGARSVVFSSASSKTAYGTAFLLARRGAVRVVGLTSQKNAAFVASLGCYDEVVTYDAVKSLVVVPAIYVDISGAAPVSAAVQEHFGTSLKHSCKVGSTHWNADGAREFVGPKMEVFFAPSQAQKLVAALGRDGLNQRIATAWSAFMKPLNDPQKPWLRVVPQAGLEAVVATYQALLEGRVSAQDGHVATITA